MARLRYYGIDKTKDSIIASLVDRVLTSPAAMATIFADYQAQADRAILFFDQSKFDGIKDADGNVIKIEPSVPIDPRDEGYWLEHAKSINAATLYYALKEHTRWNQAPDLQNKIETINPVQLMINHYAQQHRQDPNVLRQWFETLQDPHRALALINGADTTMVKEVGLFCQECCDNFQLLSPEQNAVFERTSKFLEAHSATYARQNNPYYTFMAVNNRREDDDPWVGAYVEKADFEISPTLMQQIDWPSCRETTPEAKAAWLYVKLCTVLKYDEGYFYRDKRQDPNDDYRQSLKIVGQVTGDTPTTCFNISRIAVKLLNQIEGVHATIISEGVNKGHFRFGYYTDRVSVDAEPTNVVNRYNDLARVKLGLLPTGLQVIYGADTMATVMESTIKPFVMTNKKDLRQYIKTLMAIPATEKQTQIDLPDLISELKLHQVDGAALVQLLKEINHRFAPKPYQLARTGTYDPAGNLVPLLLCKYGDDELISAINLNDLSIEHTSDAELQMALNDQRAFYADQTHTIGGNEK